MPAAAERFDDVSAMVVTTWLTTWLTAVDVLVTSFVDPPYTAVMECVPTDKFLVVKVATPPLSLPVPSVVEPSVNVTVPVGVPKPGDVAVTVAAKLTDWPNTDGLADDASTVVVASLLSTWLVTVDVLARSFVSPPYTAVIECVATDKVLVVKVATPPLSVPVPSVAEPFLNVTAAVGAPKPADVAVTVAVKVTDWPNTDGLADDASTMVVASFLTTRYPLPSTC